jgi:threonine dehydratase
VFTRSRLADTELLGDEHPTDTVLDEVAVGGGLISGITAWYMGNIKIVSVEPEAAPTLYRALEAERPFEAGAGGIAADSLAPRRVGELMFPSATLCRPRRAGHG